MAYLFSSYQDERLDVRPLLVTQESVIGFDVFISSGI